MVLRVWVTLVSYGGHKVRLRIDTRQLARVQVVLVHEFARARAAGHSLHATPAASPSKPKLHRHAQPTSHASPASDPAFSDCCRHAGRHPAARPITAVSHDDKVEVARPYTGPSCARGESRTSCPCSADSFCTLPLPAALSSMSTGAPPGWPVHSVHRRRRCAAVRGDPRGLAWPWQQPI